MFRLRRILFQVAPQAHDEVVDRARVGVFVQVPHVFEDRLSRHRLAGVLHEVLQQIAFHLRQVILLVADVQLERFEIELLAREA